MLVLERKDGETKLPKDVEENLLAYRKLRKKYLQIASIAGGVIFLAFLLALGISLELASSIPSVGVWLLSLFVGLVAGGVTGHSIYLFLVSVITRKLTENNLPIMVKETLGENFQYSDKASIDTGYLASLDAFPTKVVKVSDRIETTVGDTHFTSYDLQAHGKTTQDSTFSFTAFDGEFIAVSMQDKNQGKFRLEMKEASSDSFNNLFEVKEGVISSETENQIMEISKILPGKLSFRGSDGELIILVNSETMKLSPSTSESDMKQRFILIQNWLEVIKAISSL